MRNSYSINKDGTVNIYINQRNGDPLVTIVDIADLKKLLEFDVRWSITNKDTLPYVRTLLRLPNGKVKNLQLSRFLMNAPADKMVDHIDGNTLLNTRANMRILSNSENQINRKGARIDSSNPYRGVRKTSSGKWIGRTKKNGVTYCTKTFDTPEEANLANIKLRKQLFPNL